MWWAIRPRIILSLLCSQGRICGENKVGRTILGIFQEDFPSLPYLLSEPLSDSSPPHQLDRTNMAQVQSPTYLGGREAGRPWKDTSGLDGSFLNHLCIKENTLGPLGSLERQRQVLASLFLFLLPSHFCYHITP